MKAILEKASEELAHQSGQEVFFGTHSSQAAASRSKRVETRQFDALDTAVLNALKNAAGPSADEDHSLASLSAGISRVAEGYLRKEQECETGRSSR